MLLPTNARTSNNEGAGVPDGEPGELAVAVGDTELVVSAAELTEGVSLAVADGEGEYDGEGEGLHAESNSAVEFASEFV
jgi:hypothetical protein